MFGKGWKFLGRVLLALLIVATLVFGVAKDPPPFRFEPAREAKVCIIKFHDLDADGVLDPGEPRLGGWTFEVSGVGKFTTGPDGSVCFPVRPGLYTITEQVQPGWRVTTANPQIVLIFMAGVTHEVKFGNTRDVPGRWPGDYGDAPDSTNSASARMEAYPAVEARYPTVFAGPAPHGPRHAEPRAVAWLGPTVTLEQEADIGFDEDGVNNIVPSPNLMNQDRGDDGVLIPMGLPNGGYTYLEYILSTAGNAPLAQPMYLNVWLDFNRDGDWEDVITHPSGLAFEWAVRNELIPAGTMPGTRQTPMFFAVNPSPEQSMWVRVTLSEKPALAGGAGPADGYRYGETEDWLWKVVPETPHQAKVRIIKFHDHNSNGDEDLGEGRLPGWNFTISAGSWVGTATTNANGEILATVDSGPVTIVEEEKPGWTPTTPTRVSFTIAAGETREVFFGNRQVVGHCDLEIRKEIAEFLSGQRITYRITVKNVGAATCPPPTTVVESIPERCTFLDANGAGWTFEVLPHVVIATYQNPIAPGQEVSFTITFQTGVAHEWQLINCAAVINCKDCNINNNIVKFPYVVR